MPIRKEQGARLAAVLILVVAVAAPTPAAAGEIHPASAEIVSKVIAAHGGMEAWAEAPTVAFTEEFRQGEATTGFPGRVTVKQGPRQAALDYGGAMKAFWDGEKAWSVNWMAPTPPRFLALLNYYFANLVWLTRDPGVNLAEPGTATLWDDPTQYVTMKMTFDAGVGDTPDDYYLLFIDPQSYRLHANEYIVTYGSLLPEGAEATDPHVLVYDEYAEVDGLVVPTHYTIYESDRSIYASCVFSDWSFSDPWDESWMEMPEGAVIDNTQP